MKVLVLGGTLFLGRAVVEEAMAAGHDVTLLNRGVTNPELFVEIEQLRCDRNGDLGVLRGRSFDSIVDTSAYVPRQVRAVIEALEGRIDHYSFVSSCSVYADHSIPGEGEEAELAEPSDPDPDPADPDFEVGDDYGGLKALCEAAIDELLPERAHHVRAGLIVGPHDNTGRFTYWVHRLATGGDVLAPGPRDQPVQLIDAHDLAAWILHAAEIGVTGAVNALGDRGALTFGSMLEQIAAVTRSDARIHWVDEQFLVDAGVAPWTDLPLWLPHRTLPTHAGFLDRANDRARAAGLQLRPLQETIAAIARDFDASAGLHRSDVEPSEDGADPQPPAGLTPERERALLSAWDRSTVL